MFIVAESVVPALSLPTMERRRCETDREDEHRSRELHSVDDGQQKKKLEPAIFVNFEFQKKNDVYGLR